MPFDGSAGGRRRSLRHPEDPGSTTTPAWAGSIGFVLGSGRCGSTLVHEVLARHPDIGFLSNVEDRLPAGRRLSRWNRAVYDRLPTEWTRKGRLRFAPSEGYRALDAEVSPLLSAPCRDLTAADVTPWLAERFSRFFVSRAEAQGRPLFLHKLTGWPRARFISGVFPGARFVHVVRDGRAVANSWLQMPWWDGHKGPGAWSWGELPPAYAAEWESSGRSFVVLAGLAWKVLMDSFDAARAALEDGCWLDVRYEDVLADPPGEMKRMLEFLGLYPDARFDARLARYRFGSARTQAFRKDLDARSLAALDASLGEHLAHRGYDV